MSLFKRSVISEIISHTGVVFSTLIIVWLSILLVRLLNDAVQGVIGADIVIGIAALSTITALPIILTVTLFIAVIITISRNYSQSEMVVWFSSGQALTKWISPVLWVTLPGVLLIATLSIYLSPWAYGQIEEYKQRYALRSDVSKVVKDQFFETNKGTRVFFIEDSAEVSPDGSEVTGRVFARVVDGEWMSLITAKNAKFSNGPDGEKFIDLGPGTRYDQRLLKPQFRVVGFDSFRYRIENNKKETAESIRDSVNAKLKARPFAYLMTDHDAKSNAQVMWRVSIPIAALILVLMAIPMSTVNPRGGRSLNLIIAGLIAMLYMNLINVSKGWIANEQIGFIVGLVGINLLAALLCFYLYWRRTRIRLPKDPALITHSKSQQ